MAFLFKIKEYFLSNLLSKIAYVFYEKQAEELGKFF